MEIFKELESIYESKHVIYHISIVQERKREELNQPSKELQTLNNTTRYARNGTTLYSCSFLLVKKQQQQ